MITLFANIVHGNEPYILAASIGSALGEVVIPEIYPDRQSEILRRWVGNNPRVYLDRGSGSILSHILFRGDYGDYVRRVAEAGRDIIEEMLRYHLRDFEAVSLTGKKKRFKNPEIELNIGSPISMGRRSFYIFPGLQSEYALNSPVQVKGVKEFVNIAKETEESQEAIFIPRINSFSYLHREPGRREVPTPPLKKKGYHDAQIRSGIFVSLPGSLVLADELVRAAQKSGRALYNLPQDSRLPGTTVEDHEIIFNPNIQVVLARAGWGTLWLCQVAEKPIITPAWKETDDIEVYHNNRTVQALGLGVVYDEFTDNLIKEAVAKKANIQRLNQELYKEFGEFTWDGITFVQGMIKERLR